MSSRWTLVKSILETTAMVVIAAAVAWTAVQRSPRGLSSAAAGPPPASRPVAPLPVAPISLAGAQISGSRSAKVALVVYSDFQCPFCGRFARDTMPALEKQYLQTGKVLLAFRQFPLGIHPFAEKAAEASLCAGRQGKFWPFHNDLFANQQTLDVPSLRARAEHLGLDTGQFSDCLSGLTATQVQEDRNGGQPLGVTGTPTFFAGQLLDQDHVKVTDRFSGALPVAQFQTVLDKLLLKAGSRSTLP